jgi:hypothetical protein
MSEVALDASAIYISPSGKRCRWVPLGGHGRYWRLVAFFAYVDAPRRLGEPEGFELAERNFGLLRREVKHATTR